MHQVEVVTPERTDLHEQRLDGADAPAAALLDVFGNGLWREAIRQLFVQIARDIAGIDQLEAEQDVFGDGFGRIATDIFDGGAAGNEGSAAAIRHVPGILRGL